MDCSLPGSSVPIILQARILGWVAIPFSRVSSQPRDRTLVSPIAGRFFTSRDPRETLNSITWTLNKIMNKWSVWHVAKTQQMLLSLPQFSSKETRMQTCKYQNNIRTTGLFRFYLLCVCMLSCVWLCDHMDCSPQAPLSMEFSRQTYWSGLLFPLPGDLPDPRIKPTSLASRASAGRFFTTVPPGKPLFVL